ncbi:MAG TPA: hypothetical protein VFT22_11545 [Kofleriaceae bacterium]|nr:hypothetical protein [Kofleriaceae bacterium]
MRIGELLMIVAVASGCGGGHARGTDGAVLPEDAAATDADAPGMPPPPELGPQIDRAGRPLITSLLIAPFAAPGPTTTAQKEAYNHAADPAAWKTTVLQNNVTVETELEVNLAAFDAIDATQAAPMGCQNALDYVLPPTLLSYQLLADIFADDQLYVDTSKAICGGYLGLEIEYGTGLAVPHKTCGGRTLTDHVADLTYAVLASGAEKLDSFVTVGPHPDVSDSFPFLGPPR